MTSANNTSGVVGDAFEVVPALTEAIKGVRAGA